MPTNPMHTGPANYGIPADTNGIYSVEYEDAIDTAFIESVIAEVSQSCVLPNPIPPARLPAIIIRCADWFWQNDDQATEERFYLIRNEDFCKDNMFNKIIQLPQQIMSVQGCYKTSNLKYGLLGDFSIERMMMSSYSMYGGVGNIGSGMGVGPYGYNLKDFVVSMYEVDTFEQTLNPTLSYDYNMFSKKLIVYGDLGGSNLVIDCWKRIPLYALYNNYYFFRMCVCYVKKALSQIYGTFTFKYPGGVEINFSTYSDAADSELDDIREYINSQHAASYFFQPNQL